MKILDTTVLIAIFQDIDCPDLIDGLFKLGHDLIVTSHVMDELRDRDASQAAERFVRENKLQIYRENSTGEVESFKKNARHLGLGECSSILAWQKLHMVHKAYCIFDDRRARKRAESMGIRCKGLVGLLKLMRDRNILTLVEYRHVLTALKNSRFWLSSDIIDAEDA